MRPPGLTDDLDAPLQQKWTQTLSELFVAEADGARQTANPPHPRSWFFDATAGLVGAQTRDIAWTAYPKKAKQANWGLVDEHRDLQEEYCEWEVVRRNGKVVRVTFTTETEDYYRFLFQLAPDRLVRLYRRFVSPAVRLEELVANGRYDPHNRWNWPGVQRGALMHMGQANNTLGAAVNLAAGATWPLVDPDGVPIVSEQELIAALRFGDSARHSDPFIGAQVNELVRGGMEVSFADPPGLYIHAVDLADFELPDGGNPMTLMRQTRGVDGFAMRMVFEAPAGAGYVLQDVTVGGRNIRFGSQIAEKLKIRLRGAARVAATAAPRLIYPGFAVAGAMADAGADATGFMLAAAPVRAELRAPSGPARTSAFESLLSPE